MDIRKLIRLLAALTLTSAVAFPSAAEWGYVGCSTPDDAYSFDPATHAIGPAIDLGRAERDAHVSNRVAFSQPVVLAKPHDRTAEATTPELALPSIVG